MNDEYKCFVIICRDGVPEVTPFSDINAAVQFYDIAKEQWSESYLCEAVAGPGLINSRIATMQCYEALRAWVVVAQHCIKSVRSRDANITASPTQLAQVFVALRDSSLLLLEERNALRAESRVLLAERNNLCTIAERNALSNKCAEYTKTITELVALLRKLEWSVCHDLDECAICNGFKHHLGHKSDCDLHAKLEAHK